MTCPLFKALVGHTVTTVLVVDVVLVTVEVVVLRAKVVVEVSVTVKGTDVVMVMKSVVNWVRVTSCVVVTVVVLVNAWPAANPASSPTAATLNLDSCIVLVRT